MKLGVILPSRGLVFSKTVESLFENTKQFNDVHLYMAHDLPIPDCFNVPLTKALNEGCDLIWFLEEDMLVPEGTLFKMIDLYNQGNKAVSAEYADRRSGDSFVQRNEKGEVLCAGMGCLLVDRSIFDNMEPPYLRTGTFHLTTDDGHRDFELKPDLPPSKYGSQDIWLSWQIRKQGYQIVLVDAKIGHLQLLERAKDCDNKSQHTIKTVYINK